MKMAGDYDISCKEVEETLLRWMLRRMGVMAQNCEHRNVVGGLTTRGDGRKTRAHCKDCWTFMEVKSKPSPDRMYKGKFVPIVNKLDEHLSKLDMEDLK